MIIIEGASVSHPLIILRQRMTKRDDFFIESLKSNITNLKVLDRD
uniref:Uncharacterized protein n=1 Tax=Rhizophora mucronata TaxID=61149 RepID=A0A2P2N1T6_RHIMU